MKVKEVAKDDPADQLVKLEAEAARLARITRAYRYRYEVFDDRRMEAEEAYDNTGRQFEYFFDRKSAEEQAKKISGAQILPMAVDEYIVWKPQHDNVDKLFHTFIKYQRLLDQELNLNAMYLDEAKKVRKQMVALQKQLLTNKNVKQFKQKDIPKTIRTKPGSPTVKGGFSNPYYSGTELKYAGPPGGYDWKYQAENFFALRKALNELGFNIDQLYVGIWENRGNRINMAAVGAGGRFVWRKYDPSPGAGQNWVYIDGSKMNTSDFLAMTPAEQARLFSGNKK